MARKKSVEELDAELAALEAELAALEAGEAPPPAKGKKAKAPPPPEPAEPEAPAEAPGEVPAEPAPEAPAKPRKLGFPKLGGKGEGGKGLPFGLGKAKATDPPPPDAPPAEAPAPEAADPAPEPPAAKPRKLPFGRAAPPRAEDVAPAPAAAPLPPPEPPVPWRREGGAWRASPGAGRLEVVRRRLDESGRVVAEEAVAEEPLPPPAAAEAPAEPSPAKRRFGFGRKAAPDPAGPADAPAPEDGADAALPPDAEPRKDRRKLLLALPLLLLGAVLVVALLLPAMGVDPLGTGPVLGVGGGDPPVAVFAPSATITAVGLPVTFDATGSGDPAGQAVEYSWDFGDGSGDTGATATHSYASRGTYTVVLTVRDTDGKTATHQQEITVVPPPQARIALTLNGSPLGGANQPLAGQEVAFDAGGSTAEGGIRAYEWTFGDASPRATGAQASHAYASPGSYRVGLAVVDANGLRANATAPVYVGQGEAIAGTMAASPTASAVNATVEVGTGGGALPYRPVSLRATLAYNATVPPVGLPLPGVNPESLILTIYDGSGAIVARDDSEATAKELVVTEFAAPGTWSIEVSRPAGGAAEPIPYTLEFALLHGPA